MEWKNKKQYDIIYLEKQGGKNMIKWETLETKRIELPADVKLTRCFVFTILWISSIAIYGKFRGFGWNPLNLELNYELFGYMSVMAILFFYNMKYAEADDIFMSYKVELDTPVLTFANPDYKRTPVNICPKCVWTKHSDIVESNGKYYLIGTELVPVFQELITKKEMPSYIQGQLKTCMKLKRCQQSTSLINA